MLFFPFLLLSLLTSFQALGSPTDCVDAIQTAVSKFVFVGENPGTVTCTNDYGIHSLWAAAKVYCSSSEIQSGSTTLAEDCLEEGSQIIPYTRILPQLTGEYIKALPVVNFEDIGKQRVWNTSVLISKELYETAERTNSITLKQRYIHRRFGWAVYGFWGGILLIGIINRLYTFLFHDRLALRKVDIEGESPTQPRPFKSAPVLENVYHWVRAKVIIPAAINSYHQRLWWYCTIPTRLETIVVVLYWILSIVMAAVSYDVFYPNLNNTKPFQVWGYVADRLGNMCLANLPILWLFGGRNNIFQWATGWKYSTFNVFHRNIARAVVIQAIIHGTSNSVVDSHRGAYSLLFQETFARMGVVAVTSFSIIVFCSSVFFRKHYYEFFLLVHIILTVVVIIALFYHVSVFNGAYNGYLWPLVAIWGFERSLRFIRLAYYNIHIRLSGSIVDTVSTATYRRETDVIQIEIIPGRKLSRPWPGHHYFLYQPLRWRGWENHPFTLGTWMPVDSSDLSEKNASAKSESRLIHVPVKMEPREATLTTPTEKSPSSDNVVQSRKGEMRPATANDDYSEGQKKYKLIFWVRPCSGWTKTLRDASLKQPGVPLKVKLLIEGPYGESHSIHTYHNVLYIVGGTGISAAACYLTDHVRRSTNTTPTTRTKRITLLWTSKQAELIQEIANRELAPILKRNDVNTAFFATSGHESAGHSQLEIAYHRPNITNEVLTYVQKVSSEGTGRDRTAILVCGPAAMADEARAAVQTILNQGNRGVHYFEEAYGW